MTWSVSNGNASISNAAGSNGTLTAVGAGAVSVTASLNAVSASVNATVVAAVLNQITVSPANVSLPLGLGQAFVATGLYSNGTVLDITSNVTWSNGDPAVATTSNVAGQAGYTYTIATGVTTVVATLGAISGAANLTVTAPAVMSVTVSPSSSTLLIGLTRQFTATAHYTNGTTADVTNAAVWASSGLGSINIGGLFTAGLSLGPTTVTATYSGKSGTATITLLGLF